MQKSTFFKKPPLYISVTRKQQHIPPAKGGREEPGMNNKMKKITTQFNKVSNELKKRGIDVIEELGGKELDNLLTSEKEALAFATSMADKKLAILNNSDLDENQKKLAIEKLEESEDLGKQIHDDSNKNSIETFVLSGVFILTAIFGTAALLKIKK